MQIQQTIVGRLPAGIPEAISLSRDPFDPLKRAFKAAGWRVRFKRDTEIQVDGEPAEYFYLIESGAVRTYKLLDDGRRQIIAFHLPGDVIELEAGENHRSSAAAAANSSVWWRSAVSSSPWPSAAPTSRPRSGDVPPAICSSPRSNCSRSAGRMPMSGLASFLLHMCDRSSSSPMIELPMGRRDIADYLGLTVETVARSLTQLESTSAIRRSRRQIRVCNRAALQCLRG